MAILERKGARIRSHLRTRHLVGRSSLATLKLSDPNVSAEHAVIGWNGRTWEIHDLHSRNGTFVDGRRLTPGERSELARGAVISFGSQSNTWLFADANPPSILAQPEGDADPVEGAHDLVALPSADDPEVSVYRVGATWVVDRDGVTEPIANGAELIAGGARFTLHLPDPVAETVEAGQGPLSLDAITLAFRVSRDEEFVALEAVAGDRRVDLDARAHHALLLTLARARLRDRDEGLPESSCGWMYQEDLGKGLGQDEPHLNVTIFRCRKHLASAGIEGAASIIERRKPARQIRLGTGRIAIEIV